MQKNEKELAKGKFNYYSLLAEIRKIILTAFLNFFSLLNKCEITVS
jgi:hypothetical protein